MRKVTIKNLISIAMVSTLVMLGYCNKKAFAASEQFSTEYKLEYNFQDNGEAFITQDINITNLKSDVIASKYTLTLKQMEVHSITATVNGKATEPEKTSENNETIVQLSINNYVIGEGRQNKITLKYKTMDLSSKIGEIWNLNIPKTEFSKSTVYYNVKVSVPESFGPKIFISPSPATEEHQEGKYHYYLTRDSLTNKGISASFGKYQIVNFALRYQIQNPSLLSGVYEIALPSDIPQVQQVKYEEISPKPRSTRIDADGNVMARYKLKSNQKLEIELKGKARITGRQINPEFGGEFESIPKSYIEKYTVEQKYWETSSKEVQELAQTLKDPGLNVVQNAKKIYDHIVERLDYDFEALEEANVERHGAYIALTQDESWTCMEFADLFVATARAMGIPAREVSGYAFSNLEQNKPLSIKLKGGDLLHAWAEFYDPFYGWVQIDPTWGNTAGIDYFTKLDTNHFAFAIKGVDSEYPIPAGTYRFQDEGKLVDVVFAQEEDPEGFNEKLILFKKTNFNFIQWIKGNSKYKLKNDGKVFVYNINSEIAYLAPENEITLYLPKGVTKVKYESFNGELVEKNLVVIE